MNHLQQISQTWERVFGSYLLGARGDKGEIVEVGEAAGVDREETAKIHEAIVSQGLRTGEKLERPGASGTKSGVVLAPALVVTVRFEGVVRDQGGMLSLRGPQIVALRPDKPASECDPARRVEEMHVRGRLG